MDFSTPIGSLSGVGKKRCECFYNLGIHNVEDLLYHFPRAYQNRGNILPLAMTPDGTVGAFMLTVATKPQTFTLKNRKQITKFVAFDESGKCTLTFFNQPFIKDIFHVGDEFRFYGKLSVKYNTRELSSPSYEPVIPGKKLQSLIPVYPLTEGLTQMFVKSVTELAFNTLEFGNYDFPDIFRTETTEKMGLMNLKDALREIHFPTDIEKVKKARERFVFEELYAFALGLSMSKKYKKDGNAIPMEDTDISEFLSILPYSLTRAQDRSVKEILSDMSNESRKPMSRLLSGDVGSGKTVCAAIALYVAVKNNTQSAFMAPTEILATQHYNDLAPIFEKLGIKTALITGATTASTKKKIYESVSAGDTKVVIGTHALLNEKLEFEKLGLVITDEQHRFGVRQRSALADKTKKDGYEPHVLVMSATPIPRTLALILYGDLDISALDELPPGRKPVDTFLVDESYRERLNGFIRKNAQNNQVYIVCPMVDESDDEEEALLPFDFTSEDVEKKEKINLRSAVALAETLKNETFPDLPIGLIHGKMRSSEKDRVMRDFEQNKIKILVSTTVIEVGVNVPNAVLMVIENAERFGLSQLHQLRGRVGRGKDKSYCVLVSSSDSEKAKKRLKVMCSTNDGYKIAEADLEQRGPGDFFPNNKGDARQSGGIKFRFASLCDMELLKKAFDEAEAVLNDDRTLSNPENKGAFRYMQRLFLRLRNS
ncbi:MAG: ATP-dependent DNA helicase RecG [Ruminococcaceae bacterium]|nr:ATP-dependent DNA helicase RecG [Oscillospiraceae bacterium]